jgi:hypothetical protein
MARKYPAVAHRISRDLKGAASSERYGGCGRPLRLRQHPSAEGDEGERLLCN